MTSVPDEQSIVTAYRSGHPTRKNSRELVARISEEYGLSVGKTRNILIRAGIYISLPKDKSKIDEADYDELLTAFHRHVNEHGISVEYDGPDDLTTELSSQMGYGKWAIGEFYREFKLFGRPLTGQELLSLRNERAEESRKEWMKDLDDRVEIERIARGLPPSRADNKSGPDGCGWIFIIGLSLIIFFWLSGAENSKSGLERSTDVMCEAVGGCS